MEPDIATSPEAETAPALATIGSTGLHEFIRYALASAVALAVDAGTLVLLTSFFGVSYLLSGAIAFVLGLATIYVLSVTWVFDHRALRSPLAEFAAFALIGLVGLALNEAILWLFTSLFGFFYLISKAMSVVVVFSWNFFARKYLLFR